MHIYLDINDSNTEIAKISPSLTCGYTGCGKTSLLKKFYKQLSLNYRGKIKFVFIDHKAVEWTNINEPELLTNTCTTVEKADELVDRLLADKHDKPIFVFWESFEDYLFFNDNAINKFKRLLSEGKQKNIYIVASSSRVDYGEKYIDLFKTVFLGGWEEDNYSFFSTDLKDLLKINNEKSASLKVGEFLMITSESITKIRA